MKFIKSLVLLTPFIPKISLGFVMYPAELCCLLLFMFGKLHKFPKSIFANLFALNLMFSLISLIIVGLTLSISITSEFALLIKYAIPLILLGLLVKYKITLSSSDIVFATKLIIINLAIVTINILLNQPTVGELIWGYDWRYRIIGFTGQTITQAGLERIGNTSVAFGVYVSLILIILAKFDTHTIKYKHFYMALLTLALLLTFSRSGLVVLICAILTRILQICFNLMLSSKISKGTLITFLLGTCFAFIIFNLQIGVIKKLTSFADFSDSSSSIRIMYWLESLNIWSRYFTSVLIGSGYSETVQYAKFGFPHSESLFITDLVQRGLIGVILHFSLFASMMAIGLKNRYDPILSALTLFTPGYFLANLLGGNLFNTDFIILFLMLIISRSITFEKNNSFMSS